MKFVRFDDGDDDDWDDGDYWLKKKFGGSTQPEPASLFCQKLAFLTAPEFTLNSVVLAFALPSSLFPASSQYLGVEVLHTPSGTITVCMSPMISWRYFPNWLSNGQRYRQSMVNEYDRAPECEGWWIRSKFWREPMTRMLAFLFAWTSAWSNLRSNVSASQRCCARSAVGDTGLLAPSHDFSFQTTLGKPFWVSDS